MNVLNIVTPADWLLFEAAAWRCAQRDRGLERQYVPAEFASSRIVLPSRHAKPILDVIERIAQFVPSRYCASDRVVHNEFRPQHA